jgi:EF hand
MNIQENPNMHFNLKAAILTLALAASPAAFAEHDGVHGMQGMPKGDITKAEFLKLAEAHFDKMDTNHDGVVSLEERKAWHQQMRAKHKEMRANRASAPATK